MSKLNTFISSSVVEGARRLMSVRLAPRRRLGNKKNKNKNGQLDIWNCHLESINTTNISNICNISQAPYSVHLIE